MKVGRERGLAYARQIKMPINRFREIRIYGHSYIQALSSLRSVYEIPQNDESYESYESYESLIQLKDVTVGLISKKLINNSIIRNSVGVTYCTICQQDIYLDIIREIKCRHTYHINCIDTWMSNNSNCPDCRFKLD